MVADPESSSVPTFLAVIQNTDPGSNAGVPGLQIPIGSVRRASCRLGLSLTAPQEATAG